MALEKYEMLMEQHKKELKEKQRLAVRKANVASNIWEKYSVK